MTNHRGRRYRFAPAYDGPGPRPGSFEHDRRPGPGIVPTFVSYQRPFWNAHLLPQLRGLSPAPSVTGLNDSVIPLFCQKLGSIPVRIGLRARKAAIPRTPSRALQNHAEALNTGSQRIF